MGKRSGDSHGNQGGKILPSSAESFASRINFGGNDEGGAEKIAGKSWHGENFASVTVEIPGERYRANLNVQGKNPATYFPSPWTGKYISITVKSMKFRVRTYQAVSSLLKSSAFRSLPARYFCLDRDKNFTRRWNICFRQIKRGKFGHLENKARLTSSYPKRESWPLKRNSSTANSSEKRCQQYPPRTFRKQLCRVDLKLHSRLHLPTFVRRPLQRLFLPENKRGFDTRWSWAPPADVIHLWFPCRRTSPPPRDKGWKLSKRTAAVSVIRAPTRRPRLRRASIVFDLISLATTFLAPTPPLFHLESLSFSLSFLFCNLLFVASTPTTSLFAYFPNADRATQRPCLINFWIKQLQSWFLFALVKMPLVLVLCHCRDHCIIRARFSSLIFATSSAAFPSSMCNFGNFNFKHRPLQRHYLSRLGVAILDTKQRQELIDLTVEINDSSILPLSSRAKRVS